MTEAAKSVSKAPAPQPASVDSWQSLRNEVDRVFDRFTENFLPAAWRGNGAFDAFWPPAFRQLLTPREAGQSFDLAMPRVDIAEVEGGYKITAELPGLDEKEVEIALADGVLTIKGEKKAEKDETVKNRHVTERYYGAFQRGFSLPADVDQSGISASCAKGVLTVTLPRSANARPAAKKIEIKPG